MFIWFGTVYFLKKSNARSDLPRTVWCKLKCPWDMWGRGSMGSSHRPLLGWHSGSGASVARGWNFLERKVEVKLVCVHLQLYKVPLCFLIYPGKAVHKLGYRGHLGQFLQTSGMVWSGLWYIYYLYLLLFQSELDICFLVIIHFIWFLKFSGIKLFVITFYVLYFWLVPCGSFFFSLDLIYLYFFFLLINAHENLPIFLFFIWLAPSFFDSLYCFLEFYIIYCTIF